MKIFPYDRFTIETDLTPEEVHRRLGEFVRPARLRFAWTSPEAPYEGKFDANSFSIARGITYVNSFLPMIFGTYRREDDVTVIRVKMRPHIYSLVITAIMIGMVAFFAAFGGYLATRGKAPWLAAFSPLLVLLIFPIFIAAFWYEARKAREDLRQRFEQRAAS